MTALRTAIVAALLGGFGSLALACATGSDEPGGGGHNLPSANLIPAELPEKPGVLDSTEADYVRPWAVATGGESLRVWYGVRTEARTTIGQARAALIDGLWTFTHQTDVAVEAVHPWEQDRIDEPNVIRRPTGALWMAYTAAGGAAIGIAFSSNGILWQRGDAPVLEPSAAWEGGLLAHASLVDEPDLGRILLYYMAGDGTGGGVASSVDGGLTFERAVDEPFLTPLPADGDAESPPLALDTSPLTGLGCQRHISPIGRAVYSCFYAAGDSIGYAASFDGTTFTRFPLNPLVMEEEGDIGAPMRVLDLLLYERNRKPGFPSQGRGIGAGWFGTGGDPITPAAD